jgi:hypothetical protein
VLLQIFGYLAFSAARYPQSIVEITGLTAQHSEELGV